MRTPVCALGALLLSSVTLAQVIPVHHVYFNPDKTSLSGSNTILLNRVYEKLPEGRKVRIEVYGEVDLNQGMKYYNNVDRARGQSVYQYFIDKGVPESSISMGQSTATWKRQTYSQTIEEENRFFTEIILEKPRSISVAEPEKLTAMINKNAESRYLMNKEGGTFTFEGGVQVIIPPNAFRCASSGKITSGIKLDVVVYQKNSDIIVKDLVTKSGPQVLQSGGMAKIVATCRTCGGDGKVALAQPIKVGFPYEGERRPDMLTFLGEENEKKEVDWKATDYVAGTGEEEVIDLEVGYDEETEWNSEWSNRRILDGVYMKSNDQKETNKVDQYLLTVTKLGWINCDRFYDIPEKQDLIVASNGKIKPYVRLIFTDIKSVMSGYPVNKQTKTSNGVVTDETLNYSLTGLPKGRKAMLIAYAVIDKQAYYAQKEITIGQESKEEIEPLKMPLARVHQLLAKLD